MPILIRAALTAGVRAACSSSGGKGAAYYAGGATAWNGGR